MSQIEGPIPNEDCQRLLRYDEGNACPVVAALRQSSYGSLWKLRCELQGGKVILHGKVPSFYLKQLAQELVKQVDAVKSVVNRVDVGYQ